MLTKPAFFPQALFFHPIRITNSNDLPGCISQGKTEAEAKKNIAEAIELHISALAR
jgi:hypothetical protein